MYIRGQIEGLIPFAGIYELYQASGSNLKLVYIGKSTNIRRRLIEHSKSKIIRFDFFNYDFYPERVLEKIEKEKLSEHISLFNQKPKYNKQLG